MFIMIFLLFLSFIGLCVGIYMIYGAIFKEKGKILPEKPYGLLNLRAGNEWLLAIIGIAWSLVMGAIFVGVVSVMIGAA